MSLSERLISDLILDIFNSTLIQIVIISKFKLPFLWVFTQSLPIFITPTSVISVVSELRRRLILLGDFERIC